MNKRQKIFSLFLSFIMIFILVSPISIFAQHDGSKVIDIITINDFHGKITEDTSENGKDVGMSKIINAVNQYKAANPNTVVLTGGDNYQGSAMSNLTYGAPVSEMFKEMGVTASVVGNHEFDWGNKYFKKWASDGKLDFLGTNIIDKRTNKIVDWALPYKVIEIDGVKIGIIGLTTPKTAYKTLPTNVENYIFEPLKESAEKWVKYLRSGEAKEGKIDSVIALTHVGSFQDEESGEISGEVVESGLTEVEGIDAIISGDSHQIVAGVVNNIPIVQANKYGRALGKLSLIFDDENKLVKVKPEVDVLYNRKSELQNDNQGDAIYAKYYEELKPIINEVIGKADKELSHERVTNGGVTEVGKWSIDIIREYAATQIAVINEGAFRTSIPAGDITFGRLYDVLPFDNTLVKMKLKGSQLKKVIENGIMNNEIGWVQISGAKVYYDPEAKFGNRITEIILDDGTKVEMDKFYSVATSDFMLLGGDKYDFQGAKNIVSTKKIIRDLLAEDIRETKEIKTDFEQPFIKGKAPM